MTKLPTNSWDVKPRLDLKRYKLNTICPITGETKNLQDHHIWRKSFTALGAKKNAKLFWVEVDGEVFPNRVKVSPDIHSDLTEGRSWISVDDGVFNYYDPMRRPSVQLLNPQPGLPEDVVTSTHYHAKHAGDVLPGEECPLCHRTVPVKREREPTKKRTTWTCKVPKYKPDKTTPLEEDGAVLLDEGIDRGRALLIPRMGWSENVSDYFVLMAQITIANEELSS